MPMWKSLMILEWILLTVTVLLVVVCGTFTVEMLWYRNSAYFLNAKIDELINFCQEYSCLISPKQEMVCKFLNLSSSLAA